MTGSAFKCWELPGHKYSKSLFENGVGFGEGLWLHWSWKGGWRMTGSAQTWSEAGRFVLMPEAAVLISIFIFLN